MRSKIGNTGVTFPQSLNHRVPYRLIFRKNANDVKHVNFYANFTTCEIDSLVFLFSRYFDQNKYVHVKGLTFFNEFNKCVDVVKNNFENKQQNNEIKQIFSMFLRHEFMSQVPNFKKILQYLQKYLKPVPSPFILEIGSKCDSCSINGLECIECKINYLSACITTFDEGMQDGWDIFLRPMFGLPLFMFVLIRTEFDSDGIFNADDLITNSFSRFFYNLLCDKANQYVNVKTVQPLVDECRRGVNSLKCHELEFLLCMLRNKNTCDSQLFAPFKQFMIQLALKTKIKQSKLNKIASVVFTGFYLRLYLEGASNKLVASGTSPFDVEVRNVCRFILSTYDNERFEKFMVKLANIKKDLSVEQYIVTENHIRQLVNKHNLDEDFATLLNDNV
ncbi:P45 [Clanis bilineata nucleopolyhedrovirus]|uniref:p45 n=1 Tax=Clanis bilineata nucleopolyhedrovirus TaxID=1307957 RepID=Q0N413_9ABAC|nr:P45 [Clanis bilineata nucleopolyhedrovirus]ABF47430.1 P45 [Clanis bilineata nucleopolyhedrovirus]